MVGIRVKIVNTENRGEDMKINAEQANVGITAAAFGTVRQCCGTDIVFKQGGKC